jgi:hypothetical protein
LVDCLAEAVGDRDCETTLAARTGDVVAVLPSSAVLDVVKEQEPVNV